VDGLYISGKFKNMKILVVLCCDLYHTTIEVSKEMVWEVLQHSHLAISYCFLFGLLKETVEEQKFDADSAAFL
jgi:hypothetical protein